MYCGGKHCSCDGQLNRLQCLTGNCNDFSYYDYFQNFVMTHHHVELDFEQNLLKTRGHHIESTSVKLKCFKFKLQNGVTAHSNSVHLMPEFIISKDWLYGPATDLATRSILYPCTRYRCSIPCPCLLCALKRHPTCRTPSHEACQCQDCQDHFTDHTQFHAVFHYGCKSCYGISKVVPYFNFCSLDLAKKKFPHGYYDSRINGNRRHPNTPYFVTPDHKMSVEFLQMWSAKREQWLTDTEDISDMWCRHCNLLFWSYDDLRNHYKSYLFSSKIFIHYWKNCSTGDCSKKEDDDTKCFQCSKKFSSVKDLQRHIDEVHYRDTYECDVCGVAFSRNENLTRHMKLKHEEMSEETKHTCDECGKQFTRPDNLKKHVMKLHSERDQNEFLCHSCGKNFNKESNLKRHVENRLHKDGTVRNTCDQCGKQFCNERMLRAHTKMHHRESAGFEFASCDKTVDTLPSLEDHASSSHLPEEFNCFRCSETFAKKSNLVQHRKMVHENEKSKVFECHLCLTMFTSRFALERHEKEVFSEKSPRYECSHCNDYFCTNKQLRNHTSSEHSPYICEFCDQKFLKKSYLNIHLKRKLQNHVACTTCRKTFCNNVQLRAHMKNGDCCSEKISS